jgi:hypothetical protein
MSLAVASGCVIPSVATAQTSPKTAIFLKGDCQRLALPTANLTPTCKGALVNMLYQDGRSSFMFSDSDRSMISFSGVGQHFAGDVATQPIDHVSIAGSGGAEVKSEDATGSCEFGNAYKGPTFVRCTANTASGIFTASFRTDGSRPDVVNF